MARKATPRTINVYKSYNFVDKDPIIDILRTLIKDQDMDFKKISEASGVSQTTLTAWFYKLTRRPHFASVNAVFRALGYDLKPIQGEITAVVPKPTKTRTKIKKPRKINNVVPLRRRA
jgi:transcriptional regulator with XRE-family HTH domain